MFKKSGMAALSLLASTASLLAGAGVAHAASITFLPNTTSLPGYTTASVLQDFATPQINNGAFAPNTTNPAGTSESVTGNPIVRNRDPLSNLIGQFLMLKNASYTLNFTSGAYAQGVQYLSFLLDNYQPSSASVVLQFVDGSTSGNILAGLAGLSESLASRHGEVVIDQGGAASISAITFTAGTRELAIDEIAAAAPEPAVWLMMILGFGLAGQQLRRRNRMAIPAQT